MSNLRVLVAWELGANFGHLAPMVPVARLLRQRGHEVLFAVKDPAVARQLLESDNFRFEQAPIRAGGSAKIREPASFADILAEAGFDDGNTLHGLVAAWQGLFDAYRPDLLVSQYAPAAKLAARLTGLPCLAIETGFECPPDVAPSPCFRPWLKVGRNELLAREKKLLEILNGLSASAGFPVFAGLQQALKADVSLLSTLPELDHYQGRRGGHYIGPLFMADDGDEWHWPADEDALRIFAYLRPFRGLAAVMEALRRSGASVIAVIPGISDKERKAFESERLRVSTQHLKLSSLIEAAGVAVTHGGHGMAAVALLAGIPTLAIPTTIEQWLTTRNLERLGIGIGVTCGHVASSFASSLDKLISEPTWREKAAVLGRKYARYDQNRVVERLANTIERLPSVHTERQHAEALNAGREM